MPAAIAIAACSDTPGGRAGSDPDPGSGPVVVRTDPASTVECPYGGSVVKSGIDRNRDGALQDAEVQTRTSVCNAMPAKPPPPVVVRLVAEPRGIHCGEGGTAVQSGPDQDGNGQLDDAEVVHVDYVCNAAVRTRIVTVAPGAQCPGGGIDFQAGPDRNGNHALDDGEVEAHTVSCGDVVTGNLDIETDADMKAVENIRLVTGGIRVDGTKVHTVSLPHLEHVGFGLQALGFELAGFELPVLKDVGGALSLGGRGPIHGPQLRRVGGLVLATAGVADLGGLPALTEIAGKLQITEMSSLVSLDLSSVAVRGDIQIDSNDHLAHVTLALTGHLGAVNISDNGFLETLDLSLMALPPGSAEIGDVLVFLNPRLTHLALRADRVGSLGLTGSPKMGDVALDAAKFDRDVFLLGITAPYRLALSSPSPDGVEIGGDVEILGPLVDFEATAAVRIGGACQIDGTLLEALDLTHPLAVGALFLGDNPLLARISPITLTGDLDVSGNALLRDLDFVSPAVAGELGGVVIADNPALESAAPLDALVVAHGPIDIERNPRLAGAFGPSLTTVDGAITVTGNAGLTALRLPGLAGGVTDLMVQSNAALQSLELPALPGAARIGIAANPELRHIAFDALAHATSLAVTDNPHLPACEVAAVFAHVPGADEHQSGNDDAASCP